MRFWSSQRPLFIYYKLFLKVTKVLLCLTRYFVAMTRHFVLIFSILAASFVILSSTSFLAAETLNNGLSSSVKSPNAFPMLFPRGGGGSGGSSGGGSGGGSTTTYTTVAFYISSSEGKINFNGNTYSDGQTAKVIKGNSFSLSVGSTNGNFTFEKWLGFDCSFKNPDSSSTSVTVNGGQIDLVLNDSSTGTFQAGIIQYGTSNSVSSSFTVPNANYISMGDTGHPSIEGYMAYVGLGGAQYMTGYYGSGSNPDSYVMAGVMALYNGPNQNPQLYTVILVGANNLEQIVWDEQAGVSLVYGSTAQPNYLISGATNHIAATSYTGNSITATSNSSGSYFLLIPAVKPSQGDSMSFSISVLSNNTTRVNVIDHTTSKSYDLYLGPSFKPSPLSSSEYMVSQLDQGVLADLGYNTLATMYTKIPMPIMSKVMFSSVGNQKGNMIGAIPSGYSWAKVYVDSNLTTSYWQYLNLQIPSNSGSTFDIQPRTFVVNS